MNQQAVDAALMAGQRIHAAGLNLREDVKGHLLQHANYRSFVTINNTIGAAMFDLDWEILFRMYMPVVLATGVRVSVARAYRPWMGFDGKTPLPEAP